MRTSKDPRHLQRIRIMQDLFSWEFHKDTEFKEEKTQLILKKLKKIDQAIIQSAPTWPINKINKIDLAIFRLAVYELLVEKKTPAKVVVDEAVELAKEYGGEGSSGFVNGAIGKIISDNYISTS